MSGVMANLLGLSGPGRCFNSAWRFYHATLNHHLRWSHSLPWTELHECIRRTYHILFVRSSDINSGCLYYWRIELNAGDNPRWLEPHLCKLMDRIIEAKKPVAMQLQ